ncbi:MAG: TolB protein [Baekduia sp.]|nr:TolB protein [Baekduia sp.]
MIGAILVLGFAALAAIGPALPARAAGGHGWIALGTEAGITVADDALTAAPTLVLPNAAQPSWSPDGTQLAFTRTRSVPGGIGIANAGGSAMRMVTTTVPPTSPTDTKGFGDMTPSWSPDGTRLVFVRATLRRGDIWTVGADGSAAHRLIAASGSDHIDTDPRFLADGSGLLFTRDAGDLWSARPDGSHQRRLVAASYSDVLASPDGRTYAIGRGGAMTYVIGHDGTGLRRVGGRATLPVAFSGDGTRLVLGHVSASGRITGAATIVRTSGPARARALPDAPAGLATLDLGRPAWFAGIPPRRRATPADHEAPVSVLADDAAREQVTLTPGTARRTVSLLGHFASLLTVDQTGIASVAVAWVRGNERPRWQDVTEGSSFESTVPRTEPGKFTRYRLLVRAKDVLGHATKRPAEVIVKVKP